MSAPAARVRRRRSLPVGAILTPLAIVAVLWVLGATVWRDTSLSTPPAMIAQAVSDGWEFYARNAAATLARAGQGYLWGNLLALVIALVVLLFPRADSAVVQIAVISQCLPITAIGPLVMVIFGSTFAAVFLAALLVFFTSLIGMVMGLEQAKKTQLALVRAYGGGPVAQIRKVRLWAALPATLTALAVAVPGAMLGAILGEYLGGIDVGIGVALNAAQRELESARTWNLAFLAGAVTLLAYGLVALIGRTLTPWAERMSARDQSLR